MAARVRARQLLDEVVLPNGETVRISYSYKRLTPRDRRELAEMIAVMWGGKEVAASTMLLLSEKARVVWVDLQTGPGGRKKS